MYVCRVEISYIFHLFAFIRTLVVVLKSLSDWMCDSEGI